MPIHDWSLVAAGIFHDFHHAWTEEIKRVLNAGLLPTQYYALTEQYAAGFGPDVLTLESTERDDEAGNRSDASEGGTTLLLSPPKVRLMAEAELEFYRRRQSVVAVRHVSGDRTLAVIEVVSQGNKASRHAVRSLLDKATELLDRRIHLLILDLHPPTPRDPEGIHGAIWEELTGQAYAAPDDKPLTLVAYESSATVRAYIEPVAVSDVLPDMPLFLEPGAHVPVPLEATYCGAFAAVPRRWQTVLEPQPRQS
jgi:hypothetical protein